MKNRLAIAAVVGVATFVLVVRISRIEPVVYGVLFGWLINAGVIFAAGSILRKTPSDSN
jgi:uncharacterized membrane protein YedE/YeeE